MELPLITPEGFPHFTGYVAPGEADIPELRIGQRRQSLALSHKFISLG
jgi:hypothetical protein